MEEKELDTQPQQQKTDAAEAVFSPQNAADSGEAKIETAEEERLSKERRARRREEMKRQKQRQLLLRRRIRYGAAAAALLVCVAGGAVWGRNLLQNHETGALTNDDFLAEDTENNDDSLAEDTESSVSSLAEDADIPAALTGLKLRPADPDILQNAVQQVASGNSYLKDYAMEHAAYRASSDIFFEGYQAGITEYTPLITSENMTSTYAILLDLDSGKVVAQKAAKEIINPASMTKILTLLVAAEHIFDLDDSFTVTSDITDFAYQNDCSVAGFEKDETVTVRDLLYGTILPSGGDAAAALAVYAAGNMDAFVDMMNEKLAQLGLSETAHFTNCVGLYDENHHCTVYDMAMILKAAVENDLCREVLSAHTYTTSSTPEHPEGIVLSNWFLRRIEDKDTHGEVVCAKTGFVNQSGSCGASYAVSNDGSHYICVTGNAWSSWRCIYDHVAIYQEYTN